MKKNLLFVAMALLPVAGFVACDDDDDNNSNVTPIEEAKCKVVSTSLSQCLGSPYELAGKDDPTLLPPAYCDYIYSANNGTLKLVINNIVRNCEYDGVPEVDLGRNSFSIDIPLDGDGVMAKCLCTYSDTIVLQGFRRDIYTLSLKNIDYYANTEIDLSAGTDVEDRSQNKVFRY